MELHEIIFEEIFLDANQRGHSAKKHTCPGCGKKRFVKYIHRPTGQYLPDIYGRCDREFGCAYLLSPHDDIKEAKKAFRENNPLYVPPERTYVQPPVKPKERKLCTREMMQATHSAYMLQPLYLWFLGKFGSYTTNDVFKMYNVGTATANFFEKHDLGKIKDGATLFWQVDSTLSVRTAQRITYKGFNRDKDHPPSRLFKTEDDYDACLFGEHLLHVCRRKDVDPLICIVESEKSAMIAQLYLPTIPTKKGERTAVWMACSGSNGLTIEKISALKGYDVVLFPDFSFLNRAQWGLLPMRKSKRTFVVNGKTVERLVADPNGEIDPLYVSAKDRIIHEAKARSCQVFDVCPDRIDGGDIADYLVETGDPIAVYDQPEYDKLDLMVIGIDYAAGSDKSVSSIVYRKPADLYPGQDGYIQQETDKMIFLNPALGELINTLGMQVVSIEKK